MRHHAAVLLEEGDQIEAAVTLYRDNEDWEEMTRLIINQAPLLLKQGRNLLLEKWLTGVPSKIFEGNPWLHFWMGISCFPLNPSRSQSCLERAFEQFKERKDANGTFLAWSGMVDAIVYSFENFKPLDRWIDELEARMDEYNQLPSEEIKARVAASMFIALVFRQSQHPEIENWAEKALLITKKDLDESVKALSLFNLANFRMMTGELDEVASILYNLNQLSETADVSPLTQIRAKFAATVYYQGIGSYAACLKAMKEGLTISKKAGVHVMDSWLLMYGIAGALNHCDDKTAELLFAKMSSFLDRMSSLEMSVYHFLIARRALLQGNLEHGCAHVKLSLDQ